VTTRIAVPSCWRDSSVVVVLAGVVPTELPASCRETDDVVPRRPADAPPNAPVVACAGAVATAEVGAVMVLAGGAPAHRRFAESGGKAPRSWRAAPAAR